MTALIDQWGVPLRRDLLTQEVAGPSITGVRSPIAGYPSDGLTPDRLTAILRAADMGDPLQYFELAEIIEERDPHYAAVLQTRKRSVAQIDVTVEAASDQPDDVAKADLVRDWLGRDELADETFDMLDAVGKQISFTEIAWDTSEGQWWPERLEHRSVRHFNFKHTDMTTPVLRGGIDGKSEPCLLPAFKFIRTQIKAKSGLPVRSGLARLAVWPYLFKMFTLRDWAIFTQTFGQPVRIGKFHEGATKEDKATLFRAVANIAGDCAAIIPQSMEIEFVESNNVSAGSDLYEKRADWLDRQISKAVLGQTNTTDAQSGGLGSGQAQVHDGVREDIETADCKALAAAINRDLIRPWMDLEFGPVGKRGAYPRIVIARPKREDLAQLSASLAQLVPLGLKVQQSEVRDKFGLSDPADDSDLLHAPVPARSSVTPAEPDPVPALQSVLQQAQGDRTAGSGHPADLIAEQLTEATAPAIAAMSEQIEVMLAQANDLGEFRAMLSAAFGTLERGDLAATIAAGLASAEAAGRADLVEESDA